MAGFLAENITHFARALRVAGVPVGPALVVEAISAVELAGIARRDDFYWTLHGIMVKRREHSSLFEQAFAIYWKKRGLMQKLMALMMPMAPMEPKRPDHASRRMQEAFFQHGPLHPAQTPQVELDSALTMSSAELLQNKDFAQMSAAEVAEAKRAIAALVLPDDRIRTRRFAPAARGAIDMRRTLRAGLANGFITLARKQRREARPPLVVITDISGSMADYSRLMLHFAHALMLQRPHVQAFTFGTRLSNITRALRARDVDAALADVAAQVKDWSGGTRIAPSLHAFNRDWSRRVLGGGAHVLLVTDGLEREGAEALAAEMARLHRSCRRLIWLNPLLRYEGFSARAAGIRAMLPHVDAFRSIHNLRTMAELAMALGGRNAGRNPDLRRLMEDAHAND